MQHHTSRAMYGDAARRRHRDHRVRAELPARQGRRLRQPARRDRDRRLVQPRSDQPAARARGQRHRPRRRVRRGAARPSRRRRPRRRQAGREEDLPAPAVARANAGLDRLRPDAPRPVRDAAPLLTSSEDLVVQRKEGLYCPPGDFYIDPWRPVDRAVITHAHADHSRRGNAHYLAAAPAEGVLRTRLGEIDLQTLAVRRGRRPLRRSPQLSPGRPRARLGAGAARARGPRLGRVGRLLRRRQQRRRARGQPDLRAVRAGALPLLHHRIDLRPADLPLAAAGRAVRRRSTTGGAPTPTPAAPACCSATPSARRSGS